MSNRPRAWIITRLSLLVGTFFSIAVTSHYSLVTDKMPHYILWWLSIPMVALSQLLLFTASSYVIMVIIPSKLFRNP